MDVVPYHISLIKSGKHIAHIALSFLYPDENLQTGTQDKLLNQGNKFFSTHSIDSSSVSHFLSVICEAPIKIRKTEPEILVEYRSK